MSGTVIAQMELPLFPAASAEVPAVVAAVVAAPLPPVAAAVPVPAAPRAGICSVWRSPAEKSAFLWYIDFTTQMSLKLSDSDLLEMNRAAAAVTCRFYGDPHWRLA